ncbi:MAG TPA: cell division protein ZapA [Pseudomonas sp.]|jgi:cell division protein ZapA|nr:cell division protein ZapA [Pseudomonas sp.]
MSLPSSTTVTVTILDKEYCIACPGDARASLESAARFLDGKMREIRLSGKVIGSERVAVMAALNLAHDLQRLQQQQQQQDSLAREEVRELLDRVDTALGGE